MPIAIAMGLRVFAAALLCAPATQAAAKEEVWRSPATGIEFVRAPAGRFRMGSPAGESGRQADETQHEVAISRDFWISRYEVTQEQWLRVLIGSADNRSYFRGDSRPVDSVSWVLAQDFLHALNALEPGHGYRLPTEAEWEYACRAGGSGTAGDGNAGWHLGDAGGETHPAGKRKPNAWGLYDMLGNVAELCGDWYGAYPEGPATDPQGPASGKVRVARGGNWDAPASSVRCAFRGAALPAGRLGYSTIGFRVVKTR